MSGIKVTHRPKAKKKSFEDLKPGDVLGGKINPFIRYVVVGRGLDSSALTILAIGRDGKAFRDLIVTDVEFQKYYSYVGRVAEIIVETEDDELTNA